MTARPPSVEVRAAGGVVVLDGRVLLIHRAAPYDDWSLPKGKLDPGESWEEAAVREVEEETGLHCELGEEVGRTRYHDRRGRSKEVRYFRMSSSGEAKPGDGVDEVRWVPLGEAQELLSYERDRELVKRLR